LYLSILTGLTPGITYYVKAYATNAVGTTYGSQTSFMSYGTAWNCYYWTNGLPSANKDVFVNCDYIIGDVAYDGGIPWITRALFINNGVTLSVKGSKYLNVTGDLINNGSLVLKAGQLALPSGQLLDNGNISGSGIFKAERNLYQGNQEHFVSAPMTNVSSSVFAGNSLLKYLNPTATNPIPAGNWLTFSGTMSLMKGYSVKFPYGNKVVNFQGSPATTAFNTGVISIATSNGYNLVGNPYPSAIDWKASSGWTKTNIMPMIQFKNGSVYATYNSTTNASTNGGTRYIPAEQGFLVSSSGNGTLGTNNNVRLFSYQNFWKDDESVQDILRLNAEGGNEEGYETAVLFREDATPGFDPEYDVLKLFEDEEGITHLFTADENYTPMAQNVLKVAEVIPLGFSCSNSGRYSIRATEINLENYSSVWLEDTHTGIFTDLSCQTYLFNYTKGLELYRFRIHFKAIGSPQPATGIYLYGNDIYINTGLLPTGGKQSEIGTVQIFDMLGRTIFKETNVPLQFYRLTLNKAAGTYLVRVATQGEVFTQKVIIGR
jgi:hypothetical protein